MILLFFLCELNPKIFSDLSLLVLIVHSFHRRRLTRRNEYIHSAEVVPWQMFLATYAGMSIRKKNLSDLRMHLPTSSQQPQIIEHLIHRVSAMTPAVAQQSPAPPAPPSSMPMNRPPPPPPPPPPPTSILLSSSLLRGGRRGKRRTLPATPVPLPKTTAAG
jgi:hypothetical protein